MDYLKYDAASIQEYLKRKLNDAGVFTDQIYPGSDTSLLIDLFAWTFEALQYILNNTASNVLFKDCTLYENLNKLVKLLSYNPRAYTTSCAEFSFSGLLNFDEDGEFVIPKFAKIDTGKSDSSGNPIYYSFVEDFSFKVKNGIIDHSIGNPLLYNGEFVKYSFDLPSDGSKNEIFTMRNIGPNGKPPTNVDNKYVFVFGEKNNITTGILDYFEIPTVDNLVLEASYNDLFCEKRLNENQEFEFKFGDGIHGKLLEKGTKIHVIYLASNGPEGKIESGSVSSSVIKLGIKGISDNTMLINMLYHSINEFVSKYKYLFTQNYLPIYTCTQLSLLNSGSSSDVLGYETVEEIKNNAPSSFRIGNRLVTAGDYRTYINQQFPNRVSDVYVCNNNEYCLGFYRWLDKYDALNVNIRIQNYAYSSSCDFNNIYIWMKPHIGRNLLEIDKEIIIKNCEKIKTVTTNLVPCNGIKTNFVPYLAKPNTDIEINNSNLIENNLTRIKVKTFNTYYSIEKIKSDIVNVIIDYFKENFKFGVLINLSDLYQKIMALGYIENIRTIIINENNEEDYYINGLSFLYFTPALIENKDHSLFTQMCQLEKFQYPELFINDSVLKSLIIVSNNFNISNDEI